MDIEGTKERVIGFIADISGLNIEDIDDDLLLFSANVLDSFNMIELVSLLEKETGIKIQALELHLGNFDSVERIVSFLSRKAG